MGTELITTQVIASDGSPFHPRCLAEIGRSLCPTCQQPIENGTAIMQLGHAFHPDCFLCDVCKLPIRESSYRESDGKALHMACCVALPDIPSCPVCHQSVAITDATDVLDSTYHLACLKCAICHGGIEFGQAIKEDVEERVIRHSSCIHS